jgi:hypothetical protein
MRHYLATDLAIARSQLSDSFPVLNKYHKRGFRGHRDVNNQQLKSCVDLLKKAPGSRQLSAQLIDLRETERILGHASLPAEFTSKRAPA